MYSYHLQKNCRSITKQLVQRNNYGGPSFDKSVLPSISLLVSIKISVRAKYACRTCRVIVRWQWGQSSTLLTPFQLRVTISEIQLTSYNHNRLDNTDHRPDWWYHLNFSCCWILMGFLSDYITWHLQSCGLWSVSWFLDLIQRNQNWTQNIFSRSIKNIWLHSQQRNKNIGRDAYIIIFKYFLVPNNNIHVRTGRQPSTPC